MNPILTKIKNLKILEDHSISGTLYHNVLIPLINGTVEIKNRQNIIATLNGQQYMIRLDTPYGYVNPNQSKEDWLTSYSTIVLDFIKTQKDRVGLLQDAGVGIFKDLVGLENLNSALMVCNTFKRQGVGVVSKKKSTPDGEGIMEYTIHSVFLKRTVVTTDVDEMMVFLGSLARVYTASRQAHMRHR